MCWDNKCYLHYAHIRSPDAPISHEHGLFESKPMCQLKGICYYVKHLYLVVTVNTVLKKIITDWSTLPICSTQALISTNVLPGSCCVQQSWGGKYIRHRHENQCIPGTLQQHHGFVKFWLTNVLCILVHTIWGHNMVSICWYQSCLNVFHVSTWTGIYCTNCI